MPTKRQLKQIESARRQQRLAEEALERARQRALKKLNPSETNDIANEIQSAQASFDQAKQKLHERIGLALGNGDFRTQISSLDSRFPIALLPLKIETRFAGSGGSRELWVRAYPDDIHVHSFEKTLTDDEVAAGHTYWRSMAKANAEPSADRDTAKRAAWTHLATEEGVQRARWIAERTMPSNWDSAHASDGMDLVFPDAGETKAMDWSRAPRTALLPDRLVVNIYKGNKVVAHKIGGRIPDTVYLGPDPFLAEKAFEETGQTIKDDDSFAWIRDFNKAIAKGLGFKIPITNAMLRNGRIDRVAVLGVKVSADPAEGARMLAEQLEAHRYSEKGFSLLKQGTATNNTDRKGTDYSDNYDELTKGFYDGPTTPTAAELRTSDGSEMCRALGIDTASLVDFKNAGKEEFREAVGLNEAIYPATIGHFLEVLTAPAIHTSAFQKLRQFVTKHVTGTGPLSSVRVGDQPYGILVTSDLSKWKEPAEDSFAVQLTNILRALQGKWASIGRSKVSHVGKSGDASKIMLNIMGLSPGSVSFKQRLGHMNDLPMSSTNVSNTETQFKQKQAKSMSMLKKLGYSNSGFPLVTSIAYYQDRSKIRNRNMVDRKPPSDERFLERLGTNKINFIQWLTSENSISNLESHRMPGAVPPRSVLYLLLRHSLLLSLQRAGLKFYEENELKFSRRAHEKSLHNFDKETRDLTGWELLKGQPKKVDPQAMNIDKPLADHLFSLPTNLGAVRALAEVRRGMRRISRLSTGRLHQLLADHVDIASYRLDAWHSGLFYRRLLSNRRQASRGLYVGGYGYVEDLQPASKTNVSVPSEIAPSGGESVEKLSKNAGFVHTPSLNHATAAGVLLSGYVANAKKDDARRYEVNLSSQRTRRALQVIDGVQNDQPVEALLGYLFERGLHEQTGAPSGPNLNQYILELREAYPIEAASLPQAGSEAQETTSIYPVVNGIDLIEAKDSELRSIGVSASHLPFVREEIDRLADVLDAIGDLLTSESVYQLVQGKMDRAAGLLNSMQNLTKPPNLEVHQTPRSTSLTVSNMLAVGIGNKPALGSGSGWGARLTSRSRMEPSLNRWLGSAIGDPSLIECQVSTVDGENLTDKERITLSELKLQPIDFVFAVGTDVRIGSKELEEPISRLYRERGSVDEDAEVRIDFDIKNLARDKRSFAEVMPLAGYLRTLVATARPANATDFQPRSSGDERPLDERFGWDVDELEQRVEEARDSLKNAISKIEKKAPNSRQPKTERNPATMREFFENYYANGGDLPWVESLHLTGSAVTELEDFLETAQEFGVRVDRRKPTSDASLAKIELLRAAGAAWLEALARIDTASGLIGASKSESDQSKRVRQLKDAGESLFGDDFKVIPTFRFSNAEDIRSSLTDGNEVLLRHYSETYNTSVTRALDTWLQSVSPVRENCKRFEIIRNVNEFSSGDAMSMSALQVPYKKNDHWLAVEFPERVDENGEPIEQIEDTRSICMVGVDAADTNKRQQILVIDEWTESIRNEREITGIAYNYDQPNAAAPNAVLLAIEPTTNDNWQWDSLLGTVTDTFDRAKSRAVEPTHLDGDSQLDVLTPMTIAAFDLNESNISLDYLMTDDELNRRMKAANFGLYKGLK